MPNITIYHAITYTDQTIDSRRYLCPTYRGIRRSFVLPPAPRNTGPPLIFTRANKTEAMYGARCTQTLKLSEVQLSRLRTTFHTLPLFYLRAYARKNYVTVEIQPNM